MRIYEDLRVIQQRIGLCQYIVLICFSCLAVAFWYFQVLKGKHFRALAENNRTRSVSVAAPRGPLRDRHGSLLIENRPSFNIMLRPNDASDLDRTISRLSALLRISEARCFDRSAETRVAGGGCRTGAVARLSLRIRCGPHPGPRW